MPWESKRQQRWGHGRGGKKAGPKSESSLAFNWTTAGKPAFPGAAPPFGSKSEDDELEEKEEKEAEATFALDALPDSLTDAPGEHDAAIDYSKDGEARDTSTAGFAAASRLAAQTGITSPVSKLPPAPPGAAEKAKEKQKKGRGVEGDEGVDPMSTLDKFNWDHMPLPGMGQV